MSSPENQFAAGLDGDVSDNSHTAQQNPPDVSLVIVALATLLLILIFDFSRHALDNATSSRVFATKILSVMYKELSTLGLVEFVIFVIFKITPQFDNNLLELFIATHVAIFVTAFLYIIHILLVGLLSFYVAQNWLKIEHLEINHFLELRYAHEAIRKKLDLRGGQDAERGIINKLFRRITRPLLFNRYRMLTNQVKFHTLRAKFLGNKELPNDFLISKYLNGCMSQVLINLVDLRVASWGLIFVLLNLFFYFSNVEELASGSSTNYTAAMFYVHVFWWGRRSRGAIYCKISAMTGFIGLFYLGFSLIKY